MIEIFNLVNGKVVPNQNILLIPEFKALWESDKSKDKKTALEELTYVYYVASLKSVYQNYGGEMRNEKAKQDHITIPKWKPGKLVDSAIRKYEELQDTPSMRLWKNALYACHQVGNYFKSVDFAERSDDGKPVFKVKEVTSALKDAKNIIDTLDSLENKVKKEMATQNIRGSGNVGIFED